MTSDLHTAALQTAATRLDTIAETATTVGAQALATAVALGLTATANRHRPAGGRDDRYTCLTCLDAWPCVDVRAWLAVPAALGVMGGERT